MADVDDVKAALNTLGPKMVETKEFTAEQFDPLKVQQLLEKSAPHPTFGGMTKVKVNSLRAEQDCLCSRKGCDLC